MTVTTDAPTGADGSSDAAGAHLAFSTYWGGSGSDQAAGVALGPDGSVYLTGSTSSRRR